jgi:hypothetical protein
MLPETGPPLECGSYPPRVALRILPLAAGTSRGGRSRLVPPLAMPSGLLRMGSGLAADRRSPRRLLRRSVFPRRRASARRSMAPRPTHGHALALLAGCLACRSLLGLYRSRALNLSGNAVTLVAADEATPHGVLDQLSCVLDSERPDSGCCAGEIHHRVSNGTPQNVRDTGNGFENTGDCSAAQLGGHGDLHALQRVRLQGAVG